MSVLKTENNFSAQYNLVIQVSGVIFHHRFHRLHRFWLRIVDAISQIYLDYSGYRRNDEAAWNL